MTKISDNAAKYFLNHQVKNFGNTQIEVNQNTVIMRLFGNEIAFINQAANSIYFNTQGYSTKTTKDRLNAILDLLGQSRIYQKNYTWYLNDQPWDGQLINITELFSD